MSLTPAATSMRPLNLRPVLQRQHLLLRNTQKHVFITTTASEKPWFVDEEETTRGPSVHVPKEPESLVNPPPKDAPDHVTRAYWLLANSPLIEPTSLKVGSPVPAEEQPDGDLPLPLLKTVARAKTRYRIRGYGNGVGEGPGHGVYQWEVRGAYKFHDYCELTSDVAHCTGERGYRSSRSCGECSSFTANDGAYISTCLNSL